MVLPTQLPGPVVYLCLLRQILLRVVKRLELIEILDEFLHLIHVIQFLDHLLISLLLHAAQTGGLVVRCLFEIREQIRRQLARLAGGRTALRHRARGGVIGARAGADGGRLLPQRLLQILFHVVHRILADKIVHAAGLYVELVIQLTLFGHQVIKSLRQGVLLLGVGAGRLVLQRLNFFAQLLLPLHQFLERIIQPGILAFGIRNIHLLAQVVVVVLHADDLQTHHCAARQMRRGCVVHRLGIK